MSEAIASACEGTRPASFARRAITLALVAGVLAHTMPVLASDAIVLVDGSVRVVARPRREKSDAYMTSFDIDVSRRDARYVLTTWLLADAGEARHVLSLCANVRALSSHVRSRAATSRPCSSTSRMGIAGAPA